MLTPLPSHGMVNDAVNAPAVHSSHAPLLQLVHRLHIDWVTQLLPVPALDLCVSASLDGTLCAFGADGRVYWHVHMHRAVHCVAFSRHVEHCESDDNQFLFILF